MVWFKNDDAFYSHPKVVSIPRDLRASAVGTWTLAGTWCAHHLTDGVIPEHMIDELGGSMPGALALVKARLWTRSRGSFRFKSWEEYQPTRAQVEAARESERKRKAQQRARAKGQPEEPGQSPEGSPGNVPPGHPGDRSGSPDTPSRPDPTIDTSVSQSPHEPERASSDDGLDEQRSTTRKNLLAGLGISDYGRIKAELVAATGRDVTDEQAFRIVSQILTRAGGKVKSPQRYVVGAIHQSWAEIQQAIDEGVVAA